MPKSLHILIFVSFLLSDKLMAQTCTATNSSGCSNGYGNIKQITVYRMIGQNKQQIIYNSGTLQCNGTSNVVLNSGNPVNVISGEELFFEIYGTDTSINSTVKQTKIQCWIDLDVDDSFANSEIIGIGQGSESYPFYFNKNLACPAKKGKAHIRFRSIPENTNFPATCGCGSISSAGSIYDLEINFIPAPSYSPDFAIPAKTYNMHYYIFQTDADTLRSWNNYSWTVTYPSTITTQGYGLYTHWLNTGTYTIELKSENCEVSDSITKNITIISPKNVPNSNFTVSDDQVEIYYDLQIFSQADSGAYKWSWEMISPTGNKYTSSQQNPRFNIDEVGKWTICSKAENSVGISNSWCMSIWGIPPLEYYMGPNEFSDWDSGTLYDNGGPDLNYGNNRKTNVDYFQIETQSLESVIDIYQLKLKDTGDRLFVYQGLGDTGIALHPSGGFTKGNVPTVPFSLLSKSGTFYIAFRSNSSGTDSGFIMKWRPAGNEKVFGNIYKDNNSNCAFDTSGDIQLPKYKIRVGSKTLTSNNRTGYFEAYGDTSAKNMQLYVPEHWDFDCPADGKALWKWNTHSATNFSLKPDSITYPDLKTTAVGDLGFIAVRGVQSGLIMNTSNNGNTKIDSMRCKLKASRKIDNFKLIGASYNSTDTTLEFNYGKLGFMEDVDHEITYKIHATDTGKLSFTCNCKSINSGTDPDTTNNRYELKIKIVNALDPNDKQCNIPNAFEDKKAELKYHIRFQNTGTYPATNVVVRDTLSSFTDTNSITLIAAGHDCILERNGYALAFRFDNINLQDSGHNEPLSHGFIEYSVLPINQIYPYKKINNTAFIYFDAEKPVRTNTTENWWAIQPEITLKGKKWDTIQTCGTYDEHGVIAYDAYDGIIGNIFYTGNVNAEKPGMDTLFYTVTSSYGVSTTAERYVFKTDFKKPHIQRNGKNIVDGMKIRVQVGSIFTDSVMTLDSCQALPKLNIIPGFNGVVNSNIIGTYPIAYSTTDVFGNEAPENMFEIHYMVDDYIAPVIDLRTADTICHQINTVYNSRQAKATDNYYDSSKISIVKTGAVNAYQLGTYYELYTATDGSGNQSSKTRVVKVADCLGGTASLSNSSFEWMPNPADKELKIQFGKASKTRAKIELIQSDGKVVYSDFMGSGISDYIISTSEFSNGIYFLKLEMDGKIHLEKVLVLHP